MSDYLMGEMARIRTEDLRAEVARSRAAREVRASRRVHGPGLGFLSGPMTGAGERVFGASRGTSGEVCCA